VMKWVLVSCLTGLLLLFTKAEAQTLPSAAPSTRIFTRADTLQALHTLFLANRRRGRLMTGLVPVMVGATIYSGNHIEFDFTIFGGPAEKTTSDLPVIGALVGGLSTLVLAVTGPGTWSRNSKQREKETIRLFEQHQPLPKRVQHQLHNRLEMMLDERLQVAQQ
jgi:hypothetical protein